MPPDSDKSYDSVGSEEKIVGYIEASCEAVGSMEGDIENSMVGEI